MSATQTQTQTPPPQRDRLAVRERGARRAARAARSARSAGSGWRCSKLNLAIAMSMLLGLGLILYPQAAAWVSQFNQSNIVFDQAQANSARAQAELSALLEEAHTYNMQLDSGALFDGGANVPEGTGRPEQGVDYWGTLNASPTGTMARLKLPAIDLDLPVYHGTSERTLLRGAGHLQGTSLPVGGDGTRSVLTGHRGLANAEMFSRLDEVTVGDTFIIEVLGEVLTYRVERVQVVEPDQTEEIRPRPGRDLVTLVTCTPLGINTQRILVTGERVTPTPAEDIEASGARPTVPGFPWWAVVFGAGAVSIAAWFVRSGRINPDDAHADSLAES